jgi:isocitrate dehydrogenase
VLFSLHMKATMMKVSDPIIFGHAVRVFFADVFDRHGDTLASVGADPDDGLAAVLDAIEALPDDQRAAIEADIAAAYDSPARRWRWSTPTGASPTCTCPATSSSTRRCRR